MKGVSEPHCRYKRSAWEREVRVNAEARRHVGTKARREIPSSFSPSCLCAYVPSCLFAQSSAPIVCLLFQIHCLTGFTGARLMRIVSILLVALLCSQVCADVVL